METIDYLDRGADLAPQAACFVMGERTWSYRDARERTNGIAAGLLRDGLRPGAKAAVVSPNDPEAFLCVLGLLRAHFVWLPINPKYSLDEIVSLLERFECEALFLHSSFETAVQTLQSRLRRLRLIVSVGESLGRSAGLDQWIGEPREWHEPLPASREDVVAIMASGGTTGKPKGIMQSHRG